jgi:hypothetical protein
VKRASLAVAEFATDIVECPEVGGTGINGIPEIETFLPVLPVLTGPRPLEVEMIESALHPSTPDVIPERADQLNHLFP